VGFMKRNFKAALYYFSMARETGYVKKTPELIKKFSELIFFSLEINFP